MNRIIIGRSNNEVGIIKGDKIVININNDTNVLIKRNDFNKYVFNINNANLNILTVKENCDTVYYEININVGRVVFNNISYNSNDVKMIFNLNKEQSSVVVYNSVIAKHKVDYDIKINHNTKNTDSDIHNNGVTKEDGTIRFDVYSYAPKGSKNCKINQDSKIISLNDINDNKINPILLIDEFETEARHAAYIGNFNGTELFYLKSRGLNDDDAKNLLINGLLVGTLDVCFNEREILKNKLNEEWR